MGSGDKAFVMLILLAIIAGILFGGEPDVVDAIRNWITRQ